MGSAQVVPTLEKSREHYHSQLHAAMAVVLRHERIQAQRFDMASTSNRARHGTNQDATYSGLIATLVSNGTPASKVRFMFLSGLVHKQHH